MSRRTREINRITTAIITISIKLMVLALLILLLYEAVVRGFAFGHEIFLCRSGRGGSGERNHGRDKRGRDSKRGRGKTKEKGD